MRPITSFLIFSVLALTGCSKSGIDSTPGNIYASLDSTSTISDSLIKKMEGIYTLSSGSDALGSQFVCKTSKTAVSFFSNKGGIYIILHYGLVASDSSIQFAGFWRYSESSTQGPIHFCIPSASGARDFITKGIARSLVLQGNLTSPSGPGPNISLQYNRPFSTYAQVNPFLIFAHHGVQTTDDPPYTENSLWGVIHDQDYGVNGLEFDVHLTADSVPICVHDEDIEPRVTEKGPVSGDYNQYTFSFLDSFVRLTDGEKIPSVKQVLDAFVDSTTLTYFWLDIKGDPNIFEYLEPVVREAYDRATRTGRQVVIFADLTTEAVIREFKAWPSYADLPTLCEVSLDDAIQNRCAYWGPRYSLGLLTDQVEKAHSQGLKVFSWTLNDKALIDDYLANGKFDGFITDYPAYVVYDYYTMN